MSKTAKALGAKLRIAQGEGEEEGEEEGEGEEALRRREKVWGKSKRAYYDADNIDLEVGDKRDNCGRDSRGVAPAAIPCRALRLPRSAHPNLVNWPGLSACLQSKGTAMGNAVLCCAVPCYATLFFCSAGSLQRNTVLCCAVPC